MNLGFDLKEWEETEAKEFGEYERLELGGHEVVIKTAELYENAISHNKSLKVTVDIAGNDKQAGFFQKQYDDNNNADKKWANGATRYMSLKSEHLAYTKGFITALEKSNSNFKFDTSKGWEQLVNLKCAGVFGLEEYEKQDGTVGTTTKLQNFRSLDKLNEIKIPRVKLLAGGTMDYEEYIKNGGNKSNDPASVFGDGTIEISDNFLDD